MELYVIAPLLSLVGGGVGAYLGAYFKKKGENLATREDIDNLVVQVSAVTKATKEIESKISDEVWGRQRPWGMKRDVLFAATKAAASANEALLRVDAGYTFSKSYPNSAASTLIEEKKGWVIAMTDPEACAGASRDRLRHRVNVLLYALHQFMNRMVKEFQEGELPSMSSGAA